jgi:hypothetical protein
MSQHCGMPSDTIIWPRRAFARNHVLCYCNCKCNCKVRTIPTSIVTGAYRSDQLKMSVGLRTYKVYTHSWTCWTALCNILNRQLRYPVYNSTVFNCVVQHFKSTISASSLQYRCRKQCGKSYPIYKKTTQFTMYEFALKYTISNLQYQYPLYNMAKITDFTELQCVPILQPSQNYNIENHL